VRCGGVGARVARSDGGGGVKAGGCCRDGVRGAGGGGVTVIGGMGVVPGDDGVLCAPGVDAGGRWAEVAGAGVCETGGCAPSGGGMFGGAVLGVCDDAVPARSSSISAELPSSINRFRCTDICAPSSLKTTTTPMKLQ